jgi:hypothetical protein
LPGRKIRWRIEQGIYRTGHQASSGFPAGKIPFFALKKLQYFPSRHRRDIPHRRFDNLAAQLVSR